MTVEADYQIKTYECNGVTKVFTVPFKFFDDEIEVYKNKTYETYKKGEDYTVVNNKNSGEVYFETAPSNGDTVTIVRSVPLNQLVRFIEGEDFPAYDYEYSLDRIVMALQEMDADIAKFRIPPVYETLEEYITAKLTPYYTKEEVNNILNSYVKKTELNETLGGYYTKSEVDEKVGEAIGSTGERFAATFSVWQDREDYDGEFVKKSSVSVTLVKYLPVKEMEVLFAENDAISGNFSPVCDWSITEDNQATVTIYAKTQPSNNVMADILVIR